MHLPEKVEKIIEILTNAGFEAYAVGGCVRDFLLDRTPKDYDITTNALPKEVKRLFRRTVDTGIAHGTVTVLMGKESYEVTTYRIDGKYSDSRHPDSVTFSPSLEEDLVRRDFTINAMAYNPETGYVDLFKGREDLENKVIRAAGDPHKRFSEDALRILRAFRFSAELGFEIEPETLKAAGELKENLKLISAERIRDELFKLLTSPHPEKLISLYEEGITSVILPEFDKCMETEQNNPHHIYSVGVHSVESMRYINEETLNAFKDILETVDEDKKEQLKILRLAMLFHDFGKPSTKTTDEEGIDHFHGHSRVSEKLSDKILKRLKSDNHTRELVNKLVRYHDFRPEIKASSVRKLANKTGEKAFSLLFPVRYADLLAQSDHQREEKIKKEEDLLSLYKEILAKADCLTLKDLKVDGGELIRSAGMKPGRELGDMLNYLLNLVLEEPSWNERETLLKAVREKLKNGTE